MNTPATAPAARSARILRSLAVTGLTLAVMLLLLVALFGWVPGAGALFSSFASDDSAKLHPLVALALGLAILLGPAAALYFLRRKNLLTPPVLAAGWIVVLAVGLWLAWDDAEIRRPLPMEEFSPAFPGAAESFAVLMRYGTQSEDPAVKAFLDRKPALANFGGVRPTDAAKWREFITANRAALEADWAALAPERSWLAELAAFDRIGDLTVASISAPIIRFAVWRQLSQRAAAHASLLALDGHGDEAIDSLLPLLEVSRKLEPFSRTLVRTMIARVAQRLALDAASFVLDTATVSPEARARLAAALGNVNAAAGVRRVVLMEYAAFVPLFATMRLGDIRADRPAPALIRHPLNAFSALFFNPNATANRYGAYSFELAALAEKRDLAGFAARQKEFNQLFGTPTTLKNPGGRVLLAMFIPAYDKIVQNYWETEDRRAALAARLQS